MKYYPLPASDQDLLAGVPDLGHRGVGCVPHRAEHDRDQRSRDFQDPGKLGRVESAHRAGVKTERLRPVKRISQGEVGLCPGPAEALLGVHRFCEVSRHPEDHPADFLRDLVVGHEDAEFPDEAVIVRVGAEDEEVRADIRNARNIVDTLHVKLIRIIRADIIRGYYTRKQDNAHDRSKSYPQQG